MSALPPKADILNAKSGKPVYPITSLEWKFTLEANGDPSRAGRLSTFFNSEAVN
jgi:hypothetical protein